MMASIGAFAQQRSFDNAFAIAKRQAAKLGVVIDVQAKARSKAMAERAKAAKTTREVGYYVFDNGNGNGFTIVSGDKRMPDIVGYADRGSYSEDNVPDNLANYLKLYEQTVEAVKNGDTYATRDIAEAKYLRESGKSANVAVSPLLDGIKWNQREPFNNLCPIYDGVNNAATGCAATAMAQVMAYWQYPKQLMEDIPAYVTRSYGISMPSISKGEAYDWANMLPDYSNGYNEEQADAVAKLMAHCGSAVNMDYARESGAIITTNVLAKYFGYDGDYMVDLIRWQYSLTEWTEIINRELEAARPILYSGTSTGGGHEFVCDGSDGNGLYHINWGWGGMQNGYFDITIINPDKGGVGSGNAPDGYNRSCSMIVGIRPDNGVKDNPVVEQAPVIIAKWRSNQHVATLNEATRPNKDAKFSISIDELMYNQLCNDFTCSLAMGVKNADGSYKNANALNDLKTLGQADVTNVTLRKDADGKQIAVIDETQPLGIQQTTSNGQGKINIQAAAKGGQGDIFLQGREEVSIEKSFAGRASKDLNIETLLTGNGRATVTSLGSINKLAAEPEAVNIQAQSLYLTAINGVGSTGALNISLYGQDEANDGLSVISGGSVAINQLGDNQLILQYLSAGKDADSYVMILADNDIVLNGEAPDSKRITMQSRNGSITAAELTGTDITLSAGKGSLEIGKLEAQGTLRAEAERMHFGDASIGYGSIRAGKEVVFDKLRMKGLAQFQGVSQYQVYDLGDGLQLRLTAGGRTPYDSLVLFGNAMHEF